MMMPMVTPLKGMIIPGVRLAWKLHIHDDNAEQVFESGQAKCKRCSHNEKKAISTLKENVNVITDSAKDVTKKGTTKMKRSTTKGKTTANGKNDMIVAMIEDTTTETPTTDEVVKERKAATKTTTANAKDATKKGTTKMKRSTTKGTTTVKGKNDAIAATIEDTTTEMLTTDEVVEERKTAAKTTKANAKDATKKGTEDTATVKGKGKEQQKRKRCGGTDAITKRARLFYESVLRTNVYDM